MYTMCATVHDVQLNIEGVETSVRLLKSNASPPPVDNILNISGLMQQGLDSISLPGF